MARRLHETPLLLAVEVVVIAAPLFFHGIYGLFMVAERGAETRPTRDRRPPRVRRPPSG